ncbi:Rieske (2Fe-2S) protein [Achromobacter pestifer]|uniref:Rieske domain-containing protein n=1 Tax=Achromobacter pestifer TaxID=1353889 RepID=A0A6S6YTD6_9BURK|nr:Rieske 2Fe-2S domain-containing protein [Achromobacter pestifer]CAB3639573.1 hypothetical protein LMG3431_01975 [Achromobacter pestifer]
MTSYCPLNDARDDALPLCRVDDIPDGGSLGVRAAAQPLILLRRGACVWGYANRCPHFSVPLDSPSGAILTYDGQVVMCAHHSALFRFEDGVCVEGPCEGAALDRLSVDVVDGHVYVA